MSRTYEFGVFCLEGNGLYDQVGHGLNAFEKHPVFKTLGKRLGFEMWG